MQGIRTHCPVCKRFCGPVCTCPYCDASFPLPPLYRHLRCGAWLLATAGLLLLILAARSKPPATLPIAAITPAMQFARLHFEGTLTRTPRISRNQRSASTDLDDGSGPTLRLVFLEQALHALRHMSPPLTQGSPVRVQGSLRISADEPPVMFLHSPEQFARREPAP